MKVKYTKTQWVNEETPLNSDNLNKIEDGIEAAANAINANHDTLENLKKKYKLLLLTDNWPCIERILKDNKLYNEAFKESVKAMIGASTLSLLAEKY